jgi:hypothetical protein
MAKKTQTHIVVFKEANERYAKPEIYTCAAKEADDIEELLDKVCDEGDGPIGSLSDTEFVEKVGTITLAELQDRFADELEAAKEEEEEEGAEGE